MLSYIILFSLSLLFLVKFLISASNANKNYKKLPPSPPSALPILGHLPLAKKPLHHSLTALSSRYGPIILRRFGLRRILLVSSAPLAEQCFTRSDLAFASRPRLPSARHFSNNYTSLSSSSYGPHWRNLRRVATLHVFSAHRISSFSSSRAAAVRSLVLELFQDTRTLTAVEMNSRLFKLVLDVMMGMMAGKTNGGEGEEGRSFKEVVEEGFRVLDNLLMF